MTAGNEPTRTMWTKSLFEGLYRAIEKGDPRAVRIAVADLKSKEFPMAEIVRHVREDKGDGTAATLKRLLEGPAKPEKGGLVAKLKGLFS